MKRRYKNNLIYSISITLNLIPVILWGNLFNVCCILIFLYFWGSTIFDYKKYNFYIHEYYTSSSSVEVNQGSIIYKVDCSRMDKVRTYYGMCSKNIDLYPEIITFLIHVNSRKINYCIKQQETRPIKLKSIGNKRLFSKLLFFDEYESEHEFYVSDKAFISDNKLEYLQDSIFYNINVKRISHTNIEEKVKFFERDKKLLFDVICKYLESDEFRKEFDIARKR